MQRKPIAALCEMSALVAIDLYFLQYPINILVTVLAFLVCNLAVTLFITAGKYVVATFVVP